MRRLIPSSFESIRGKAKLFHRSIEVMQDDGILLIGPNYRLTDAQADLARVLGFEGWAELKLVASRGHHHVRLDAELFSSMVGKLSSIIGSRFLAAALLVRLGFGEKVVVIDQERMSLGDASDRVEFARGVDLLSTRLMELEPSSPGARTVLRFLETCKPPSDAGLGAIGYIESILAWARFAVGGEKTVLAARFADHAVIERIGDALPQSGFFAMSGSTGSGRSHAGIVLARHMRGNRRVVFSLSAQCGLTDVRLDRPGGVVFIDDMPQDDAAFNRLAETAKHSIVILCVVAGDHVDAHNRVWFKTAYGGRPRKPVTAPVGGGVHFERNTVPPTLTPWKPHASYPHTTFFVNEDGRVYDDVERHLKEISDLAVLRLPHDPEGSDRRAAHGAIVEELLKTTAPLAGWRGTEP